ncbi:MAG: hypothetical protein ACLU37_02580 [Collinsella sp.]
MFVRAPMRAAAADLVGAFAASVDDKTLLPADGLHARGMRSHATERSMFMLPNTATMRDLP